MPEWSGCQLGKFIPSKDGTGGFGEGDGRLALGRQIAYMPRGYGKVEFHRRFTLNH